MPQYPIGLQCETLSMPNPPNILDSDEDGGKGGGILWGVVHRGLGVDTGRPDIPYHF